MASIDVYSALTDIFREQLRNPLLLIEPSMTSDDVSGWDSGATVAIIMLIEERFDFEPSASELKKLRSVGDFADMIQQHVS